MTINEVPPLAVASPRRYLALVPAAGRGTRVGAHVPKQYLTIHGQMVIVHVLSMLLSRPWIDAVHVVASPGDRMHEQDEPLRRLHLANTGRLHWHMVGGATRRDSVLAGLRCLGDEPADSWVLVHDAARPGVDAALLDRLRATLESGVAGAVVALPVADTLKRESPGEPGRIEETVARDGLWQAQTPQAFGRLALEQALLAADDVTDEAAAMERQKVLPWLVRGSWRNAKLTTPQDRELLELALAHPAAPLTGGADV
ncbi:MAG: 2-C-methyl-D-erythritol 4-phosphate cytidylyltransferase [Burkholderiaceae bacterium]